MTRSPPGRAVLWSGRSRPGCIPLPSPDRAQKLGAHARYHSSLPPHLSELAILVTGRIWKADFEWYFHVGPARDAGVSEAVIEAIRTGTEPPLEDDKTKPPGE